MEFSEGLRWTIKDASRVYGVPETMMAELQYATLSNNEAMERWFWRNTVIPEASMIAERLTTSLLPKIGYAGYHVEFDFSGIEALAESEELRIKREAELLDRGVITINEVRQSRNLQPVPWGDRPFQGRAEDGPPRTVDGGQQSATFRPNPDGVSSNGRAGEVE